MLEINRSGSANYFFYLFQQARILSNLIEQYHFVGRSAHINPAVECVNLQLQLYIVKLTYLLIFGIFRIEVIEACQQEQK